MTTRKKIIISLLSLVIVLCVGICIPSVLIARAAECTDHEFSGDWSGYDDEYHWHLCSNCAEKCGEEPHVKVEQYDNKYHWTCCECNWFTNMVKHTFASPTTAKCDGCEYSRTIIDYSGYEIGGLIKDFKITIPEDVKSIAFTENSFWEIYVLNEKNHAYDFFWDFPNAVFLPNVNYYVRIGVAFDSENYYKQEVKDDLVIGGLGGAVVEQQQQYEPQSLALTNFNDTLELELILPKLGGVSPVQKISSLNYTVSGCELGSPVNQMQFTPVGDAVCDLTRYAVYKNEKSFYSDSSTNEVFDDSSLTKVKLYFIPHDGYIFEGITEESFNIEGFGEIYDINIISSGSYLIVEYVLPSLVMPHTCGFYTESNHLTYHWQECGICGTIKDKEEHVYGLQDRWCTVCSGGDPEHTVEIEPIVFDFSGYEVGSPANISVTVNPNEYLLNSADFNANGYGNCYVVIAVDNLSMVSPSDSLAPYTDYYLSMACSVDIQVIPYVTLEHFQLKGVGAAEILDYGPQDWNFQTVLIYFRLPQLTDESLVSSLNELNLTVKNFAVGNEISDVGLDGKVINPVELSFRVFNVVTFDNVVITQGNPYELMLQFTTSADYPIDLLEDFTKDKLTVNGADKLLSFEKYYKADSGRYVIEVRYSLVLDYEHEHAYETIDFSYVAHWQLCECGAAINIAEHDISWDPYDENFNMCSYCHYRGNLEIDSIEYTLNGYKVGNYAYELDLESEMDMIVTWSPNKWVCRITNSSSALLGNYQAGGLEYEGIKADTTYYLSINVRAYPPFSISPSLIAKNITLKGYGTAKYYYYAEDVSSFIAVFELPKLELIHHIHGGLFVDEEISICGADTKIKGYYQCTVCDKYFDKQNNEINLGHKFTKNWQSDDDKHWLQCEVCGLKQNEEAHNWSTFFDVLTHGKKCSVCGLKDVGDHVYESATDNTCDECGFKRIVIDYSGYCVDGSMADFVFTISENNFGASLDENSCTLLVGEESVWVSDKELLTSYFRPNEIYVMRFRLIVPNNFNPSQFYSGCFMVAGVGGVVTDFYVDSTYIEVYFTLPVLGGVSTIETVENLDIVVDGLEVGNLVNNINVTLSENSAQAIFNVFYIEIGGTSYNVDSQTDKLFESGTVAYIELLFMAAEGYTFYGFTKEAITISGLSDFDIYVFASGGAMWIDGIADFRDVECKHDVDWTNTSDFHNGTCAICLEKFNGDHVDNDDDLLCDVCGDSLIRTNSYIYGVEATLQGYELDNKVSNVTVTLAKGTQGINWENAAYGNQWIISTDVACGYPLFSDYSGYFAPDQTYYLAIKYRVLPGYNFGYLYKSDLVIKGIGEPLYILANDGVAAGEALVVYELPMLKGTSKIKPVGDITVDVSGYVYNGTVQDTSVELREECQSISRMNAAFYAYGEMQGTDVFDNSKVYNIKFELYPAEGYDFRNFTEENFTLNGVSGTVNWFYIRPNNFSVEIGFMLEGVEQQHTCDNAYFDWINADYHQVMCSTCHKIQSEQEAHNYVDGACALCHMPYHIDVNSITFKLEGYELGKEIANIKLTTDCKDIKFNSTYGIDYVVYNTPLNCNYQYSMPIFSLYEDMFLHVKLVPKDGNVWFGMNFSEKDVVIEGLGAAELMTWGADYYFVVFRLPKFEYPHNHGGVWIDEVPATCTATGTKGYYECTVCGKYFDEQNAEIEDLTIGFKHSFGEWIDEVPATTQNEGVKGHKDCLICNKHFDADGNELLDLTIEKLGGDTPDDSSAGNTDSSGSSSGSSDETESCVSSVYSQSLIAMFVLAILVLVKSKRAKQN